MDQSTPHSSDDSTDPIRIPPRPPLPPAITEPISAADVSEPEATTLPLPVIPTAAAPAVMAPAAQAAPAAPPRRRHRGRTAVISIGIVLVVLAGLGIAGWFGGNAWARTQVIDTVMQQTRQALGLPAGHKVQVAVDDPVLPQLIGGTLTELNITVPDAPIGGATGTVTVHATGVPIRGDAAVSAATATVRLSPDAITTLVGDIGRTVPGSLHIAGGDIAVSLDPSQFLSGVSFTLTLHPSVHSGALVLTPTGFEVGGAQMSADIIRARFGSLAAGILAPRTVCVADRFPKGMTLTAITLDKDAVTATFAVDPHLLTEPALQRPGTCS
ncbi:hypothetical protein GCM10022240_19960 [Microbacterium kribbense]|uniref:DUF2993 domain-containing protein n=1 Tax=Microbacterium kribbense TaxID=433645 RepID=A0ABP7GKS1_9MICO